MNMVGLSLSRPVLSLVMVNIRLMLKDIYASTIIHLL